MVFYIIKFFFIIIVLCIIGLFFYNIINTNIQRKQKDKEEDKNLLEYIGKNLFILDTLKLKSGKQIIIQGKLDMEALKKEIDILNQKIQKIENEDKISEYEKNIKIYQNKIEKIKNDNLKLNNDLEILKNKIKYIIDQNQSLLTTVQTNNIFNTNNLYDIVMNNT